MHRVWLFTLTVCGACLFSGCQKPTAPAATAPTLEDLIPKHVQERLPTTKLWVGPGELTAELAVTTEQMETGMMYRTNMAENEAMLFAFPEPFQASFWMKNTVLPLSAAYVAPDGTIMEIHPLQPQDTTPVVAATNNIQFVIETTQGWFDRHGVSTGMVVRSEAGSLQDLYHGK